jgi:hypothetical protein
VVHPHPSSQELLRFTTIDHRYREAFVAVAGIDILGVGRHDRLPAERSAAVRVAQRSSHPAVIAPCSSIWWWHNCGGQVTAQAHFGGLTIPSAGGLGWFYGTDRWNDGEFFR